MTIATPMFPPRANRLRASKRRRPRSVRPRFKQPSAAVSEPILPPQVDHLDAHVQFGREFYDAFGAAARDGHPLAALIRLRQEAADEIERLLAFLDETDGADDLQDDADPTDWEIRKSAALYSGGSEDDEDGSDHEPSLGFLEPRLTGPSGLWFAHGSSDARQDIPQGGDDDREGGPGCDDREPDVDDEDGNDDEPSLGWTSAEAAIGRVYAGAMGDGRRIDLEEQCDDEGDQSDSGIGDSDGLMEQVRGHAGYGTSGFARHVE